MQRKFLWLISPHQQEFLPMPSVSVPYRVWSMPVGKHVIMQALCWLFNVHYIPPGGNYFNAKWKLRKHLLHEKDT